MDQIAKNCVQIKELEELKELAKNDPELQKIYHDCLQNIDYVKKQVGTIENPEIKSMLSSAIEPILINDVIKTSYKYIAYKNNQNFKLAEVEIKNLKEKIKIYKSHLDDKSKEQPLLNEKINKQLSSIKFLPIVSGISDWRKCSMSQLITENISNIPQINENVEIVLKKKNSKNIEKNQNQLNHI